MSGWRDFATSVGQRPPEDLSRRILNRVNSELAAEKPAQSTEVATGRVRRAWRIFGKLALIQLVSGLFTLSICPQFGIRLLGDGLGLMTWFMAFGNLGCVVACGSFFTGTSLLLASIILKPREVRTIRQNVVLAAGALTLLSMGFFIMVRAEVILDFAIAWGGGSIAGGSLIFNLGARLRGVSKTGA